MEVRISIKQKENDNQINIDHKLQKVCEENGLTLISGGFGSWCGCVMEFSNEDEIINNKVSEISLSLIDLNNQRNKLNRQISTLKKANLKQ